MPITSPDIFLKVLKLNWIIIPLISMLMKKQIKNLQYLNKINLKFDKFFHLLTIMQLELYHLRKISLRN